MISRKREEMRWTYMIIMTVVIGVLYIKGCALNSEDPAVRLTAKLTLLELVTEYNNRGKAGDLTKPQAVKGKKILVGLKNLRASGNVTAPGNACDIAVFALDLADLLGKESTLDADLICGDSFSQIEAEMIAEEMNALPEP